MAQNDETQTDSMDDTRVGHMVFELSRAAPKELAKIELECREELGFRLVANKAGFLRLAVESLRAAIAPLESGVESIQTDWKYMFIKGSPTISEVWRTETVQLPAPPTPTRWEKVKNLSAVLFILVLLLFLLASTIVGCFTIVGRF